MDLLDYFLQKAGNKKGAPRACPRRPFERQAKALLLAGLSASQTKREEMAISNSNLFIPNWLLITLKG
jgi:hypothetical protein